MTGRRFDQLSDRQAECLRLLGRGLSAKNIAGELDLSYETVNAHLKAARRVLGVGRSLDAARLLLDAEGRESVGNHGMGMAAPADDPAIRGIHTPTVEAGEASRHELRDARTPFLAEPALRPPRPWGRRLDDLSYARRSLTIVMAMVACAIVVAGLAAIAASLQKILWSMNVGH